MSKKDYLTQQLRYKLLLVFASFNLQAEEKVYISSKTNGGIHEKT